jgi:type II secretory ATPase GspE/PulE/Tfp pilus assembly ATPase PilB-like protein
MAKIGEILIQKGMITLSQRDAALEESRRENKLIGQVLISKKFLTEGQLLEGLAEQFSLTYYPSLSEVTISQDVIKAVPAKLVKHYTFMPLSLEDKVLKIALSDPLAVWPTEDLKLHMGFDIERVLATDQEIRSAIHRYYGVAADTVEEIMGDTLPERERTEEAEIFEIGEGGENARTASVIKLVNQILSEAIRARATDIHIEPFRDHVQVRHRIDGVLYEIRMPEAVRHLHQSIVSRIKILCRLNVVERRLPQDGRATVKVEGRKVDLRVSIIPGVHGENVVIRVLPAHLLINLEEVGLMPADQKIVEELLKKPHGILFLTGPTGSGKTTTLYACLSEIDQGATKIITIEDPVEYELSGIMQIQVQPEIGLTFSAALRSILRHDPDVMMVGEVRDLETAELAIRTALTGHMIFSTLHTNDAASGATRLVDIGIEPYLVVSSVNAFISQRLIRVICPSCKVEVKDVNKLPEWCRNFKVWQGTGCDACGSLGYKGRSAIHEILLMNDEIREMILNRASATEIKYRAIATGFKTLFSSGLEKIKAGITTPDEVLRVTEPDERRQARREGT